ncbi:MAG TPA: NAD(P)-dependent oxidoreductase [Solirubrobacteraceae bacterium]|nr:NAD(P)-dependent oxidoreductase [Solirubrobacteraceae bacterium]
MSAGGSPRRVGFVGLGTVGGPMARRLLEAGHQLSVYDTAPIAVSGLAEAGAEACESARGVADVADLVLVSLPSPEVVSEVARDLAGGSALRVYVDLSTTGPQVAEEVAELMGTAGVGVVDAPVSGGRAGAESGRLTVMVAGAPEDVAIARPVLELLGSRIFVVGEQPGQGQAVKVINNLMSACSIAITAEATSLGVKAGVDPATLLEVVAASSGSNTAAAQKFPAYVLTRSFEQGFRLNLMAKDVRLCLSEARRHNVPMLLGATVEQLWNLGEAKFPEDADFIEIVRMFEDWANVTIESGGERADRR